MTEAEQRPTILERMGVRKFRRESIQPAVSGLLGSWSPP